MYKHKGIYSKASVNVNFNGDNGDDADLVS